LFGRKKYLSFLSIFVVFILMFVSKLDGYLNGKPFMDLNGNSQTIFPIAIFWLSKTIKTKFIFRWFFDPAADICEIKHNGSNWLQSSRLGSSWTYKVDKWTITIASGEIFKKSRHDLGRAFHGRPDLYWRWSPFVNCIHSHASRGKFCKKILSNTNLLKLMKTT